MFKAQTEYHPGEAWLNFKGFLAFQHREGWIQDSMLNMHLDIPRDQKLNL